MWMIVGLIVGTFEWSGAALVTSGIALGTGEGLIARGTAFVSAEVDFPFICG